MSSLRGHSARLFLLIILIPGLAQAQSLDFGGSSFSPGGSVNLGGTGASSVSSGSAGPSFGTNGSGFNPGGSVNLGGTGFPLLGPRSTYQGLGFNELGFGSPMGSTNFNPSLHDGDKPLGQEGIGSIFDENNLTGQFGQSAFGLEIYRGGAAVSGNDGAAMSSPQIFVTDTGALITTRQFEEMSDLINDQSFDTGFRSYQGLLSVAGVEGLTELPANIQEEFILRNMEILPSDIPAFQFDESDFLKSVRPGVPGDGGGAGICSGSGCGTATPTTYGSIGEGTGLECPPALCPRNTNSDNDGNENENSHNSSQPILVGCLGKLCGFPDRQPLPTRSDGRSEVSYVSDEHADAVLVMLQRGEDQAFCSGVLVAPTVALTALHCMSGSKNALFGRFKSRPDAVTGWMRLTLKNDEDFAVFLYSDVLKKSFTMASFSIPYATKNDLNEYRNKTGFLPKRDIAVIHLNGGGLDEPDGFFPFLNFKYTSQSDLSESISFAGFGITNVDFPEGTPIQGRKLVTFNFHDGVAARTDRSHSLLTWRNGDPIGTGGPCKADSGGPVYAGFNRGYWDDPRQLIGIVSAMEGKIADFTGCLDPDAIGLAEELAPYRDGICNLGSTIPRGC